MLNQAPRERPPGGGLLLVRTGPGERLKGLEALLQRPEEVGIRDAVEPAQVRVGPLPVGLAERTFASFPPLAAIAIPKRSAAMTSLISSI